MRNQASQSLHSSEMSISPESQTSVLGLLMDLSLWEVVQADTEKAFKEKKKKEIKMSPSPQKRTSRREGICPGLSDSA